MWAVKYSMRFFAHQLKFPLTMPTDFRCSHCDLVFTVGPFHYHRMDSGYGGCRKLVCKACGTQHGLEAALRDRGSEFIYKYAVNAETVPASGRQKVAQWISRQHKTTLKDALDLARHPPFVVASHVWEPQVDEIRSDLEPLGVVLSTHEVEKIRNSVFGPLLRDRLRFCEGPAYHQQYTTSQAVDLDQYVSDDLLQCQHCAATGSLVWEFRQEDACPSCKQMTMTVESSWIT